MKVERGQSRRGEIVGAESGPKTKKMVVVLQLRN